MKCFPIYILLFIGFGCQQINKEKSLEGKLVQHPLTEPVQHYRDSLFTEDFYKSNHYSYSVNILKDSTSQFHTTETVIIDDTLQYILKVCEASISNDSLILSLTALQDSINEPYHLTILKKGHQYSSELDFTYAVGDTNWRRPVYTTFDQNIILDKEKYNKGDSLKGKFSLLVSGHHTAFDSNFIDTLKIYGLIKTIVQ